MSDRDPIEGIDPSRAISGVHSFFERHVMAVEQTPDGAWRHTQTMALPDMVGQFGERHVGVLGQGHKLIAVGFKTIRPMVAAPRTLPNAAGASLLVDPFDRGRGRDAEKLCRRAP
ncbi:MAG: hypothetical protein R3F54_02210 [Alphaproteobacteria bacterium]